MFCFCAAVYIFLALLLFQSNSPAALFVFHNGHSLLLSRCVTYCVIYHLKGSGGRGEDTFEGAIQVINNEVANLFFFVFEVSFHLQD